METNQFPKIILEKEDDSYVIKKIESSGSINTYIPYPPTNKKQELQEAKNFAESAAKKANTILEDKLGNN